MARDWVALVRAIEGYYPVAQGAITGQDESLRQLLVPYGNQAAAEISKHRKWRLSYFATSFVTVAGTQLYTVQSQVGGGPPFLSPQSVNRVYFLKTSGGLESELRPTDVNQARSFYGAGANAQTGEPERYAFVGTQLQIFPAPDTNGPTAGNYTIVIEGQSRIDPIFETTGTTLIATPNLTVPSTDYLTANGAPSSGSYLSIRNGGFATGLVEPDTFITPWSSFSTATNIVMGTNAVATVTTQPVYLNSANWLIWNFEKVLLFALLREVAAYLQDGNSVSMWDARFEKELLRLEDWDMEARRGDDVLAAGTFSQRRNILRNMNIPYGWWWW